MVAHQIRQKEGGGGKIIVDFSRFDIKERPILILKNAGGNPICLLGYAHGITLDLKYNEVSSLEFDLPAIVDGKPVQGYDDMVGMRVVELVGVGQFTVVSPEETGDGVRRSKHCKCYSLDFEFSYKKISLEKGTYNFYNPLAPKDTLLGIIMEKMPSWRIGDVSDGLINKYRTYEVNNENLYNFIKSTVQESYNCIFDFDTQTRTVSVKDVSLDAAETPVFISTNNLAKEITLTEDTENIVTRLDVSGADGVNIRSVNPCGTNKIICLDYYMISSNFSQALITKYYAWKQTWQNNQQPFYALSIEYAMAEAKKTALETALRELVGEKDSIESQRAVTVQAIAQGLESTDSLAGINNQLSAKQAEIDAKQGEIDSATASANGIYEQMVAVRDTCSFEKYFTEAEQKELDKYIRDDEIEESSFVATEVKSYTETPTGTELSNVSISLSSSKITKVTNATSKEIYDFVGGTLSLAGRMTAEAISGVFEKRTDNTLIITAYLSKGTISGNSFPEGCMTFTGTASSMTSDVSSSSETPSLYEGTTMNATATGYLYFTLDTGEYERCSISWELYRYGLEVLNKLAQPTYTFSVSSANFFHSEDYTSFRENIRMGRKVYIQLMNEQVLEPICIGVNMSYEDPASLELHFSDSYVSSDSSFKLADLLDQSVSMGRNLELSKYMYSSFTDSGAETQVRRFMSSALDAAKNAVITSSGQALSFDGAGFRLRKYANDSQTTYEDEQIWMINNSIVMTDDNWATAKMAIGKFHDENLGDCWGIVAPRIVGTILAGSSLIIESAKKSGGNAVFRMDADGCHLYNCDFTVNSGNTQISLNPYIGIAIGTYPVYTYDEESGTYEVDEDNAKLWADTSGNLHLKGTLHGANGDFTGTVTATTLIIQENGVNKTVDDYISASTAVSDALSTANSAWAKANAAQSDADAASTKAQQAAAAAANALQNGASTLYFGDSSVARVYINSSVGFKVTGVDGSYLQITNNAMGFFKSTGSAMMYYSNGNMILDGYIYANGGWIGGQNGWSIGSGGLYSGSASYFGASGGIYMGRTGSTYGISIGSLISMKADGTFTIRADATEAESDTNYILKLSKDGSAYTLALKNIVIDDSLVINKLRNTDKFAVGETSGIYRVTSTTAMNAIAGATNGDLCVVYSSSSSSSTAVVKGSLATSTSTSPGYLAPGAYDATGHVNVQPFGITTMKYWNINNLSGDNCPNYYRVGVGTATSAGCGMFLPFLLASDSGSSTTITFNFTVNRRPSGASRDLDGRYYNGLTVELYRVSGSSYTKIANSVYTFPSSWSYTANTDHTDSISLSCSQAVSAGNTYYLVMYSNAGQSQVWIKSGTVTIDSTEGTAPSSSAVYIRSGGSWEKA